MIRTVSAASIVASFLLVSGGAHAAKCNIVGKWTDSYGIDATFTTLRAGTATAPAALCPKTYKLKVTSLSKTVFDVTASVSSCPTAVAKLTFASGSCTSASGTITADGQSVSDTWTKTGKAVRARPSADISALSRGLR